MLKPKLEDTVVGEYITHFATFFKLSVFEAAFSV